MLKLQNKVQAGFTIIELLIVIAIIGILATLVLTNFQGASAKGRDTVRKNDINSLYQKLEEYHNEFGGYPDGDLVAELFPGIDQGALTDAEGTTIASSFATGTTTVPDPTTGNTGEYAYAAYGCVAPTAQSPVGSTCEKYVLEAFLEREATPYTKSSLN